jgi:methylated-DNA-[protein]-cysteine S-methyltransferase
MYYTIYQSPFGPLVLAATDKGIAGADFRNSERPMLIGKDWISGESPFRHALKLLDQYFGGKKVVFDLDYDLSGTDFQRKVWQALLAIKPGSTLSYGEFATRLGKPSAARAAGAAIGKNPVTLLIPCHRVIGANGSLTGFAGGLALKRKLLEFEGVI